MRCFRVLSRRCVLLGYTHSSTSRMMQIICIRNSNIFDNSNFISDFLFPSILAVFLMSRIECFVNQQSLWVSVGCILLEAICASSAFRVTTGGCIGERDPRQRQPQRGIRHRRGIRGPVGRRRCLAVFGSLSALYVGFLHGSQCDKNKRCDKKMA